MPCRIGGEMMVFYERHEKDAYEVEIIHNWNEKTEEKETTKAVISVFIDLPEGVTLKDGDRISLIDPKEPFVLCDVYSSNLEKGENCKSAIVIPESEFIRRNPPIKG